MQLEGTIAIDPVFRHIIPLLQSITDRPPVVVEVGMHHGETTRWFHVIASRPIVYYGFEPDPRNLDVLWKAGYDPNAYAVGDQTGKVTLYLSEGETPGHPGRVHTDSSSIRRPTEHFKAHPWCKFERTVEVAYTRLDDEYCAGEDVVDLIWADVQGAQLALIRGAKLALSKTRFLYIEVHPTPMYEGEPTFEELCEALGDTWEIVERYPADVFFRNTLLVGP